MRLVFVSMIALMFVGCVPKRDIKPAQAASESGNWDEAFRLWSELYSKHPDETRFKLAMERSRLNASLNHLRKASRYFERDMLAEAAFEVNLVLAFDPHNQEAQRLTDRIAESRQADLEAQRAIAKKNTREPVNNLPQLKPKTWAPLNLTFVNQSVRDIYLSLGKAYGINIVVDSKIRDEKIDLDLRNMSFLKALDTLMVINRHFFKLMDDNTMVILEDNKQNRDRYDNQIVQTFYLSNITPKDLKPHLRQLGGIKEFAENEKLNAITIKGTPEQIALARKIIGDNDKAQAEVVVELELLEVNKSRMRRIGIMPVDLSGNARYQAGVIADPVNRSDSDANQNGLRGFFPDLQSSDFLTIVPALAIDFLKENGDSKQVANPHLRVTSGETGSVRIGQSIPIAQTSFTNAQISGSSTGANNFGDQALTTFDYNDVGINIQVTPRVHYNNEITLELEVEVSSVISGGLQPILGKRNVKTHIRLKNGEINVMAGLLDNNERKSLLGFPGLSDIPLLGRLFSNDEKVISQTDIILSTRPVIIRGPNVSREDRAPYEVSSLRLSSLFKQPEEGEEPETDQPEGETIQLKQSGKGNRDRAEREPTEEEAEAMDETEEDYYSEESEEPIPAMLAFTPAAMDARVDQEMEFQLFVTNVEAMRRGEIVLNFDAEVLSASSVKLGDFFGAEGSRPLLTPAWDNTQGKLTMVITQRHGVPAFSGSGILATVTFKAKAPGEGELVFDRLRLTTPDDEEIPAEGLPGRYEVSP